MFCGRAYAPVPERPVFSVEDLRKVGRLRDSLSVIGQMTLVHPLLTANLEVLKRGQTSGRLNLNESI